MAKTPRTKATRWNDACKPRGVQVKPKGTRAIEVNPRKPRVTKVMHMPKVHDIESLGKYRGKLSKKLVAKRLLALNNDGLRVYQAAAKISIRTARNDRGPKLRPGWLTEALKEKILKVWENLVKEKASKATHAELRRRVKAQVGIEVKPSQCQRLVASAGLKKPKAPKVTRHNNPAMQPRNFHRV